MCSLMAFLIILPRSLTVRPWKNDAWKTILSFWGSVTFQGELSNLRLDMTNLEKTPLKTQSLSQFSEKEKKHMTGDQCKSSPTVPTGYVFFCPCSRRAGRLPFIAAVGKGGYIPCQDLRVSYFQVWFHEEFWGCKKSGKYGRKRRWHPDIGKFFLKTTFWGRSLPSTVGRIYHTYLNYCGLWRLEILDPTQKKSYCLPLGNFCYTGYLPNPAWQLWSTCPGCFTPNLGPKRSQSWLPRIW